MVIQKKVEESPTECSVLQNHNGSPRNGLALEVILEAILILLHTILTENKIKPDL